MQPSTAFPWNKRFSKNGKIYEKVKLGPSNVTKIKTLSHVVSKNFDKILIYISVYTLFYTSTF